MKKELKNLDGYMKGIVYGVQEKAWMDETGMLDWTEHVWKPYVLRQCRIHLLIMDGFEVHMVGSIMQNTREGSFNTFIGLMTVLFICKMSPTTHVNHRKYAMNRIIHWWKPVIYGFPSVGNIWLSSSVSLSLSSSGLSPPLRWERDSCYHLVM